MNWIELRSLDQIEELKKESAEKPVIIFKHSTRCNISRTSLDRLQRHWNEREIGQVRTYYLDLLKNREISNELAAQFNIEHQSPQVLIIANGKSVLDLSHFEIEYDAIRDTVQKNYSALPS